VQIIDEYTGRVMADRSWEHGLHQLIEVKEGCPVTQQNVPLARISYQRFFRRYQRLAGMTGTAREWRASCGESALRTVRIDASSVGGQASACARPGALDARRRARPRAAGAVSRC
jgi:hypothetical protein